MRIGIVSETFPPEVNGVALTVRRLVDGLRRRQHDVHVVRPRQTADIEPPAQTVLVAGAGIPNYPGMRFGWPAGRTLRRLWQRQRPDVVYVATEGPLGGSALRAARALGIPAASGFHTRFDRYAAHYGMRWMTPLVRAHLRRFHRRAAATLVPTDELATELAALGIDNVRLLQRSVDGERFHPRFRDPQLRAGWGVGDDDPVMLYVGRIAPEKNLDQAVRAFHALQRRAPQARFVWVGDGPARRALQTAHPDFIFVGTRRGEALARHYASGDLFVFPSLSETFGNVILEALASGVPAVAFDTGAAHMYLRDDVNGYCIGDGDPDGFDNACARLADTVTRQRMAAAARRSVAELDADTVVRDFETLLADLCGHPNASAGPAAGPPRGATS